MHFDIVRFLCHGAKLYWYPDRHCLACEAGRTEVAAFRRFLQVGGFFPTGAQRRRYGQLGLPVVLR